MTVGQSTDTSGLKVIAHRLVLAFCSTRLAVNRLLGHITTSVNVKGFPALVLTEFAGGRIVNPLGGHCPLLIEILPQCKYRRPEIPGIPGTTSGNFCRRDTFRFGHSGNA